MKSVKALKTGNMNDADQPNPKGDQIEDLDPTDVNPRTTKADETLGNAGVKTPWQNSHQITRKGGPHWQTHHQNSQGLSGQTSWEHKGAKRGGDAGPQQRVDAYRDLNSWDHSDQNQGH